VQPTILGLGTGTGTGVHHTAEPPQLGDSGEDGVLKADMSSSAATEASMITLDHMVVNA
jgi:hypothetical protein